MAEIEINIAVASNIKFYKKALPVLLTSLKEANINNSQIHIFIGGFPEYKFEKKDDYNIHFINQNSYEYSPLIEIVEKELKSQYWFLIHDTCKVGPRFKELLYNIPDSLPEKIALKEHPSMSMGLYRYDYLLSLKEKLLAIKNTDFSEESMIKWKDWGVYNEDYIMFKTPPTPSWYPAKKTMITQGVENWFGTDTLRIVEYYPGLDVYKNKANWGQTNGHNGKYMVRNI